MKNYTKKTLLSALVIASSTQTALSKNQEALHHKSTPINVPSIVDGTPFGINGHEIRKLIFIMREVEKLMFGIQNPETKVKKGKYIFQNVHHCISSLAEFENENAPFSTKTQKELNVLLNVVTDEFIKIATPFVEQARGVKSVTLGFMKEWAEKHDCEDSSLLNWAKEKDGHEFDTFKSKTKTFAQLYQFCNDLTSFLSDLIHSCPRAWQQFMALQSKKNK